MFVFNGTNESLAHPHLSQKACFCWMNSSTISVTSISWHRIQRWHRVKPPPKKTHPCIVFRQRDSILFSWLNMYVYTNYVLRVELPFDISKYDTSYQTIIQISLILNVSDSEQSEISSIKDEVNKPCIWFFFHCQFTKLDSLLFHCLRLGYQ